MKSGKGYTKNLLLAATIVSLSTTMPMNVAYADNPTPTRGEYAAYTITGGTAENYNFTASDGSTTSYYKTNLSVFNLLNNINDTTVWLEGTQENNNFSVVLPNNETRYFIYGYTKPDGWGDGARQTYDYNDNAAGNSSFYNNRTFNGLNSTVSGGAIDIQAKYQATTGSNLIGSMTADFINNSITNTDTSEKGLGGALHIWGPYAGIETLNSNFINNHITYNSTKSGGGALAIGEGYNGGESTVGLINGNFINNYIDAPSSNFGGAIYYEGSSYGNGEITSIGQDPVHTTKFVGNHILGTGQGGAIYAVNKIGSIYADFIGNYIAGKSDNSKGGAISLGSTSNEKNVGLIVGDFIGNYITTSANNGSAWGGAIYNNNIVGSITGDFIGNYIESTYNDTYSGGKSVYGGAIYNTGTIGTNITGLTGNFIGNYANGQDAYGGAIYNTGTITTLNGKFIENDAYANIQYGYNAVGGAIANKNNGVIENISGDFIRNKAHTSYTSNSSMMATGGAIYNEGAKIGTISANFIENEAQRQAGAIYNNGKSSYNNNGIGTISGNFIKNKVTGEIARELYGGAIFNEGTIGDITANFTSNSTQAQSDNNQYYNVFGGAIANNGSDSSLGDITGVFDGNSSVHNFAKVETGNFYGAFGGAIYNNGGKIGTYEMDEYDNLVYTGGIKSSTFQNNKAESNQAAQGGAIWTNRQLNLIDTSFVNNSAISSAGKSYGGAIYAKDYNSSFENLGVISIKAKTANVTFSGNKAENGAAIYSESNGGTFISASGGNILFENNNKTGAPSGTGTGIYTASTLFLNTENEHTITINDNIDTSGGYGWGYLDVTPAGGNIYLNGSITTGSSAGIRMGYSESGALVLGQTPANQTFNSLTAQNDSTLSLQNNHAGDNLVVNTFTGSDWGSLKFNIDYDATANSMDKITVKSGSGTITLNAVNVLNDNASFVDGTPATYLDGTARNNITVISDAITSTVAGTTVYTFTPDSTTHGLLSVSRAESYAGDLINAIQDTETVHPTAYSMQDNFTADRNFGALNTDNRDDFTIFGNNHTISGDNNTYTGIEVASDQTLNLDSVRFSNVKTYDVQNKGTLNLSGTNIINTLTDAATPTGTTNITGGNTVLWTNGSIVQNTVNLKGGNLLLNSNSVLTANIVADGSLDTTGILNVGSTATINGSISGTFKGNNEVALLNKGTIGAVTADFTNNINEDHFSVGAIHNEGTIDSISGNFTGNSKTSTVTDVEGGAIHNEGTITNGISNSTFKSNTATSTSGNAMGGAIYQENGTLTISDSTFGGTEEGQGNSVNTTNGIAIGGAIYQSGGNLTIADTSFTNNSATSTNGNAYGGAIYQEGGTLSITNSTFTGNSLTGSDPDGSAISIVGVTSATIDGSEFTGNSGGRVIYSFATSLDKELTITNSNIHDNLYSPLRAEGGTITIQDTNIKDNAGGIQFVQDALAPKTTANIIADTADVEISGNEYIWTSGNSSENAILNIYAKNHDITIQNNTSGIGNNGFALTMNADEGHNITINDAVASTTGMTVNAGGTHLGTVALNGALTLGDALNVNGGTLTLNDTAASSMANKNLNLNGGALTLGAEASEAFENANLKLNGGIFDIANNNIDNLTFANAINNAANSYLALDVSLGDTNTADKIASDITGASTIYLSDLNFISDSGNGGEVQIADGNIKSAITVSDVAGGYANVQYNNSTGVLSFADKIAWLEQTNGSQSGYRFTKTNNGIMPVNYTSGENNYTFYTDILKKNYADDNSVAHDLKYTWDNSTHLLSVTNSDDTALSTTKSTIVITGDGSAAAPFVYTGDHVGNTAIGLNRWNTFGTITGDFVGNTNGAIAMGMGVNIPAITGNFIGNTGGSAFSFSGDHSWGSSVTSITGDFIGNYNNYIYNNNGGAIYIFNWNNGGIGTITGDFIGNKAGGSGGAICLADGYINSITGNFVNNYAENNGGALQVGDGKNGANITVTGDFIANQAISKGGALYNTKGATTKLVDSSFIGNIAPQGAAIYLEKGTVTVSAKNKDIEFTNNNSTGLAGGDGYGIYNISDGYKPLVLNANEGRTLTVNDKVYSEKQISINNFYTPDWAPQNGTVIFNNEFTQTGATEISSNESNAGGGTVIFNGTTTLGALDVSGTATLKLGTAAGNSTFGAVTFSRSPILDIANNSAQTLTVASIKNNAKINIDLDFTGDSVLADAINITTGGKTGVLTINDINAITSDTGVIREFTNLAILTGETDGVTLALSESIQQDARFNGDAVETITWEDDYNSSATFDNTVVTSNEYSETKQKHLYVVDGTKLSFDETTTVPKHATGNSNTSDFLKELNTRTDATRTMTAVGAEANTYTVGDNLGATAAGTLNVTGKDSGSNLNMNGKSGFELSNANTTLALSNLNITNINDTADGGLINITGENSSATLTSVTVGSTTNSAIVNNRTLTLEGNTTINTGIKGTGAINSNGTVALNGALAYTGATNVSGGTFKLGASAATADLNTVTFTNNPTLDLQNSSAQTLTTDSISGNAKLNIDIDFTGDSVIADAINITTGGQTGVLTINSIAALASDSDIKTFENLAILTGETTGVTLALSEAIQSDARFNGAAVETLTWESDYSDTATFAQSVFTNTEYSETKQKLLSVVDNTKLSYAETTTVPKHATGNTTTQDVLQALNQSTSATRSLTTDSATAVYTVGDDLGTTGAGTLTVQGVAGSELNMNGASGFVLTNAGTVLNLKNLNITGLADENTSLLGIANLEGTKANLENITVSQAITKNVIDNLGELNFAGTNTINSYIGGTGTTNINGGKTILAQLVQNTVNITAGELEVANITTTSGVTNAGTLTLTGTSNANAISGTGHTVIAGNINNTGSIGQAITVNGSKTLTTAANLIGGAVTSSGTVELTNGALSQTITGGNITISATGDNAVTASAANLGGTITNNGNLLLSGTLDKTIGGTTGVTKLNDNMTFADGAEVAGTLNFNGKAITMSGDDATSTFNVGKITSDGTINIDINTSGATPVYDAINLTAAGSTGTITINSINEIGSRGDDFTLNILQGTTGGLQLALSDAVHSQFDQAQQHNLYYVSDAYQANIDFDKISFNTTERDRVTQKAIGVQDNTKIVYTTNVISDTATGNLTQKDALAFINQNTDTSAVSDRSMVTTDSNKTYTVQEDLGTTGAGTLLVQGASDKSTILDMNNKTGFVVSNSGTTVTLKDINVNNVQNADGALVNITSTGSSATLDGAVVNVKDNPENKANVISSNGTVTVKNSTVNAGINNTGTLDFEGTSSANKVAGSTGTTNVKGQTTLGSLVQKLVNIVTGGKLIANGDVTTGTGTGEGINNAVAEGLELNGGTLTGNVTGSGSVKTTGNSAIADGSKVSQDLTVESGKLTTSANGLGGAVTNSGEVDLTGGTLETSITGGSTTISGNVGVDDTNGSIASAVKVETGAKLTTNASNVTGTINNGGDLDLTGGDIQSAISGTGNTTISGAVTNTTGSAIGNAVTVASTGDLTTAANLLGGAVSNSGTVKLDGGTLSQTITGGNISIIDDVDTNASNLAGTTSVASAKELTLTGGDVNNNISGAGTTKVTGSVNNKANISTATEVNGGALDNTNGQLANVTVTSGSLKSDASKVGTVANSGTYEITGGTIANAISGTGNVNITGNVINNAVNTTTGAVSVAAGKELAVGTSGDTFGSASSLTMGNNSTLNIQNGTATAAVINNLVIASGDNVNVKMDWGDTLNSSSTNIAGGLTITDINMASSTSSYEETSYAFTNLGNKVALSEPITLSGVSDTTNNFVKYDNTTGSMASFRNSLLRAVDKTEAGETATYVMTTDETAGGQTLEGKLLVQGDGHTITTAGVKVHSSTATPAELTLQDTNMNVAGKAIEVTGNNKAIVKASGHDITLQTTDSSEVVSLNKSGTDYAQAEMTGAKTITINGDIKSDDVNNKLIIAAGSTVSHAGLLDPITTDVDGTYNRTSGYDETVTFNVNAGGQLNYTNDTTLYDAGHHTAALLNTINFNGGSVNTINGVVTDFHLANMSLNGTSNFYADVDLANSTMDKFTVSNPVTGTGKLNVAGLNLISDATADTTTINFTTDPVLMAAVNYTGSQGLTALSPIYKYNVGYDNTTGNFGFNRYQSGGYGDYNPAIMAAPVAAQLGGYLTQLNSYDEAFRNMDMYMLMTASQRQALKNKNKVASIDGGVLYDATLMRQERAEGWFRPFATFEKVPLKNGPKVENIAYGTYMGGESQMYDLGHGWDGIWGAYVGYNGSHQNYDGVSIYQNGGTLGVLGMAYKGNFFTGLTINAGASGVEASTMYGNEDFAMLMAGIASKTGYNWELFNGKFIIQPSMLMSYSFVNTFDYRNAAGVKVDSDPLHAIQLQPEIKFIGNLKNGWQPYASVAMVWNIMDDTKFKANDVSLPELSVKPYVKYGVGVRKTWGERLTGFFQTYLTNGGRNGVGLQAGFTWAFGGGKNKKADEQKIQKSLNKTPELKKTEIVLNGKKVQ